MGQRRPWWKSLLLNARALGVGVLVAAVLTAAYVGIDTSFNDDGFLTPFETARIAAVFSALIALQLLLVCVPLWVLLSRLGWAGWASATALGFVAPLGYLLFNDWLNGTSDLILDHLREGLPLGLCGALAGLAVWWARPKPAPRSTVSA